MNVLLIAPDLGLPAALDEVRAVSAALRPVVLTGKVTRKDLLDALRGHTWDTLWFATHGDEHGIMLSDGAVSVSDLTAVVRSSGASLVVLNSCSSRLIGLELYFELGCSVITTQTSVDDLSAYQTGTLLARYLGMGMSAVDAFAESKPGQGANYLLFAKAAPSDESDEVRTIQMLNEWGTRLLGKIDGLEQRMDREMRQVNEKLAGLESTVRQAVMLPPWHRTAFAAAFGLLFMPVPLFYSQVRDLFDIGWQAALMLAFTAYMFSAVLWSYMWWGSRN